jgi:lysozyme
MNPIPKAAFDLIKKVEGRRLEAYPDPGNLPPKGDGTPWTIGYGETGPDIKQGTVWTIGQCEDRLKAAVAKRADAVDQLVTAELTSNQRAALISFVYNIGIAAFKNSTLRSLLNKGLHGKAADEFPKWNKSNGTVLAGLVARREEERKLFLMPD